MRVALVDAYGISTHLPAELARYGIETVHVHSEAPDRHLAYRGDFRVDLRHTGDVAATAVQLARHEVKFVVAGTESGVLLADALSDALGTPGNGMRNPAARRDKHAMALAVREAGLPAARGLRTADADELVAWAARLGSWPVVLKPLSSAGTDNVHFCGSPAELRAALAAILADVDRYGRRNEAALAQEYLRGDEYFVNTVSRDGVHHVVEVWRYHKRTIAGNRWIYDYEHPVPPADPVVAALSGYTLAVLDALEVRNGAAHTEVMLTAAGPVLVESGARCGGSHLPAVVTRCLGTNQVEALARAIARPGDVTGGAMPPYALRTGLRYVTLVSPRPGVVPDEAGLARIRGLGSYLDMVLTSAPGTAVPTTVDLATSPGYVYLSSADPDLVEADYRRLRELEQDGLYDDPTAASPAA